MSIDLHWGIPNRGIERGTRDAAKVVRKDITGDDGFGCVHTSQFRSVLKGSSEESGCKNGSRLTPY